MGMKISIYNRHGFTQHMLPPLLNGDHSIVLRKEIYGFEDDALLGLEAISGKWYLDKSQQGVTANIKHGSDEDALSGGDIVSLLDSSGTEATIIVWDGTVNLDDTRRFILGMGETISIGAESGRNDIVYQFHNYVSRQHCVIQMTAQGCFVNDISSNGTFLNGKRLSDYASLNVGDVVEIFGLKIVYMGAFVAVICPPQTPCNFSERLREFVQQEAGTVPVLRKNRFSLKKFFHRSPRNILQPEVDSIEIQEPPAEKEEDKKPLWMVIGPSFTMVIPMMAGSILMIYSRMQTGGATGLYMYTGVVTAFGAATVGIFWAINNVRYNRKMLAEASKERFDAYAQYLVDRADDVKNLYDKNRSNLLQMYPAPEVVLSYGKDSAELWNRNSKHSDYLAQRVGIGEMPFPVQISVPKEKFTLKYDELAEKPREIRDNYSTMYQVPITVDLLKNRLVGIVGGEDRRGAFNIARLLTAQIAASDCYTDVKLVYIYDEDYDDEDWSFARWFPHVWSEDKKSRYVAGNKSEASDVFFELMQIFRLRAEEEHRDKAGIRKPYYIMFVSNAELLNGELITKYMYECDPNIGLTSIILTESMDQLPNECEFVIESDADFQGTINLADNIRTRVNFDHISSKDLERFARRLASIEVKEMERGRDIPDSIDFLDMHEVHSLGEFDVEDRWRKNRTYENLRALLGIKGGGEPCYLDVHEKYHGPHGLVAGTTGSGKSETLQTYLLSLAINFSPYDVGYFIIDYKGGGMAGLFEGLPHMLGSISNLSGNQVRRAMVSIKSENRRRQRVFNESGVNNINNYTKLFKSGEVSLPVPHLFIIIDEFAELKREEPEFMKELISVAQVGRSLGVHLILATQKPSGTVDDNIWSNSKFRLCLRVQDQQDSKDMLHKPDAAFITQAGRGYLQVGTDEVYELFQSGYSGAPYNGDDAVKENIATMVSTTGKEAYVTTKKHQNTANVKQMTQMDAVKNYLAKVADESGYTYKMMLWMPLLPTCMYLNELEGNEDNYSSGNWKIPEGKWNLSLPIGLCDDPVNQAQMPLVIDFSEDGHLAIVGGIASGKSTFIQSLLYGLIHKYSPEYLNIYALDFSSQMQGAFENAPHVGGVMFEDDADKIAKFFYMMNKITDERKKLFRGGNYAQYVQVNGVTVPAIIIAIDGYSSFREKTGQKYDDDVMHLAKEGVGYGIYLVLSGGGFSSSEIPAKLGDSIKTTVTLQLNDKYAYMDALRKSGISILPEDNTKGRGLCVCADSILEYQTALSLAAGDDFSRVLAITDECKDMDEKWAGNVARKIPTIPEKPIYSDFEQIPEVIEMQKEGNKLAIGFDMVSADIYGVDLKKSFVFNVSGKGHTGKTNLLKAIIKCAANMDAETVVIEHDSTELQLAAERAGARYVSGIPEQAAFFSDLVEPFKQRNALKKKLLADGVDEIELFDEMSEFKPIFIVIADMVSFVQSVYKIMNSTKDDVAIWPFVENIAEKGKYHKVYFFVGVSQTEVSSVMGKKVYEKFIGEKTGIHLGGDISSVRYFEFSGVPFAEQSKSQKPGVGYLPTGNDEPVIKVCLPQVKG